MWEGVYIESNLLAVEKEGGGIFFFLVFFVCVLFLLLFLFVANFSVALIGVEYSDMSRDIELKASHIECMLCQTGLNIGFFGAKLQALIIFIPLLMLFSLLNPVNLSFYEQRLV